MGKLFEDSQSLRFGEKRAYMFTLKKSLDIKTEDLMRYYKAGVIELGKMQIQWIGSLGEKNKFYTKTVSIPYSKEAFTIKLIDTPQQITVEEPRTITLQIFNLSANVYRLKLYIKEEETQTIAVNAISHQEISRVNPFENFTIQMLAYPKHSGIQRLTGLHAIDLISKRDLNFGVLAEFLVLGHKALESSH